MLYLQLSETFNYVLTDLQKESPIARKLLNRLALPDPKINFLDIQLKGADVLLSFLDSKRIKDRYMDGFNSKLRQESKVGKGLKKIFPDSSDDDVRTFVEKLQGKMAKDMPNIFMVDGTEVRKYYQWRKKYCTNGGQLNSSCYQGIANAEQFEVIERNPDVFRMVICMVDGKLDARCLLVIGIQKSTGKTALLSEGIHANTPRNRERMSTFINDYAKEFEAGLINQGFTTKDLIPGNLLDHVAIGFSKNDKRAVITNGYYNRGAARWWDDENVTTWSHHQIPETPEETAMYKAAAGKVTQGAVA